MVLVGEESEIIINGQTFPAGSARGIVQTLDLDDNGQLRRTVNGTLIDLTRVENRKFSSNLSANDMSTPTLSGLWKGQQITIECLPFIRQTVSPVSSVVSVARTPVTDSIKAYDINGETVNIIGVSGTSITFGEDVSWLEYRPTLTMLIQSIQISRDEYGAEEGWSIDLLEV